MPLDPVRVADVRAWLAKAHADLRTGHHTLTAAPPLTSAAVFHAQQAAEKALKALLAWHDIPFRKTHDLAELGIRAAEREPGLEPLVRRAAVLTEYAWKYRYPGEADEPSRQEAEEALALAGEVREAVLGRVPLEARP